MLSKDQQLFHHFTNVVYRVGDALSDRPILLFNMSINYGIAISSDAEAVVAAARNGARPTDIANDLDLPCDDIIPLLSTLLDLGFLSRSPTPTERSWVPEGFNIELAKDYPFEDIIVGLTDRCNLACSYCFNSAARDERIARGTDVRRLSRTDIARIAGEFAALGGKGMIITGGEPTLNPEFLDICEDAASAGLSVKVITNGTRLTKLDARRLVAAVDVLAVSLDSLDSRVNAELWQVSKYHVADILAEIGRIGRTEGTEGRRIMISLKPTLTAKNINQLEALLVGCLDHLAGCRISFDISAYEPIGNIKTDASLRVSVEHLQRALMDSANAILRREPDSLATAAASAAAEAFALSMGGKLSEPDRPTVMSCVPSLFVTNGGDLYPCQALEIPEFKLGTVHTSSLAEGFEHSAFKSLRRKMSRDDIAVCGTCEFRFVCTEHCHGAAFKLKGETNAFLGRDTSICKARVARRLWIETQLVRDRDGHGE